MPSSAPTGRGARPAEAAVGLRAATWIALVAFAVLALVSARHGQDLTVFWRAARRLVSGAPLYRDDEWLAWRYAPGAALLFAPLAALPLGWARAAWLVLVAGSGVLLVRSLARRTQGAPPTLVALCTLLALARPLVEEFACGQVNLVLTTLLVAAFAIEDRRPVAAGALLAVAVGLKLAPAILVVDAVLRRRGRVLGGVALAGVLLVLAPVPFYGLRGTVALHGAWFRSLTGTSPELITSPGNQSVFGVAARLGIPSAVAALACVALLGWLLALRRRDAREPLLLWATAFASPMGWIQNHVFGLPAVYGALGGAGGGERALLAAVGVALLVPMYDLGGPRLEAWAFERSVPALALGLLLACAAWRLVRRDRRLTGPAR